MTSEPAFSLGNWRSLDDSMGGSRLRLPARHLTTHGVIVGMTGSGKSGLVTVLVEECARGAAPDAGGVGGAPFPHARSSNASNHGDWRVTH